LQTRTLTQEDAVSLIEKEESHFFDVKAIEVSGKSLQKSAVAFANSDGGQVLVGIDDAKVGVDPVTRWRGFTDLEKMNAHLQVLFSVEPSLPIQYEFLACDTLSGYVLNISIEKGSEVHKTSDGTVYQRHGAQSLPVSDPAKLAQLAFAKGAHSFEDQTLGDVPPDQVVDSEELSSFLADYSPKTDPLDFALGQNLIDFKTWAPRVASVLLFHPAPSAAIPRKCAVKVTRYETREDEPERDHLAEQVTVEGPSYRLIHSTVQTVTAMMSAVKVWTSEGLKSLEYPPEAVWEILTNAIIHRDYSISDDIQVLIFDDRIEILSPGKLPGYVNIENILDARFSRNPKLVRTLNRYSDPPNKDLGEGLNTAFQKMKDFGLKSPVISEESNYLKVTLPHAPLAAPTEAIMRFLASHDQVTNRQARELTGIKSENLVKNEFYKLRDEGLIERIPGLAGPKSAWRLTKQGKAYVGPL
jgi:ATP-dependent DNA helicase RecG